ncbi:MAG: hypothetical protein AAGN82_05700, partial [Myxococcota bacterium]
ERPPAVTSGDDVKVFGGHGEPPHRHDVIGTVAVASPHASDATLIERHLRPRAAAAGGTALHRVDCSRLRAAAANAGASTTVCGAHVLRSKNADFPGDIEAYGEAVMRLERTEIAIQFASGPSLVEHRSAVIPVGVIVTPDRGRGDDDIPSTDDVDSAEVGTMTAYPPDHAFLGTTTAVCLGSCARSTLARALRIVALQRGAVAIAEVTCELDRHISACSASLVGPAVDAIVAPEAGEAPPLAVTR